MIWTVPTDFGPIVVREQLEPDDEPGLLELFAACDDWFEAVNGTPSGPGDVQSLFYALPEGASFEDKRLFTIRDGDKIVGLIDAVLGFPHRTAAAVGLFLIAPSHRRRGLGVAVAKVLLAEARETGLDTVTASAHDSWPQGQEFLRALGFAVGPPAEPSGNRAGAPGEAPARRATLILQS
ncbi:GNAT family N-acetyltransferase [Jiangella alkaliphila]|uniref:Acetyltransferase (GNAT) family protein n=1 Tax=Jiangella alkaliphila TaxID=419479 RepID=A0A1H2IMK1_9ACTN|nr:GNAT family N-acetyltransferase [Jiangella alkaliphila]SDU45387.1 Acetyltransferase (GNAT) family protein [Jiangella alkaliphila]